MRGYFSPEHSVMKTRKSIYIFVIYDIAFAVLTIIPTWFLPFSRISIIEIDVFLACLILSVLFFFHHENTRILGITGWLLMLACGLLWSIIAIVMQPIWRDFAVSMIESGLVTAVHEWGPKLPSALIIAVGLSVCYGAIVGLIREILIRLFERTP